MSGNGVGVRLVSWEAGSVRVKREARGRSTLCRIRVFAGLHLKEAPI